MTGRGFTFRLNDAGEIRTAIRRLAKRNRLDLADPDFEGLTDSDANLRRQYFTRLGGCSADGFGIALGEEIVTGELLPADVVEILEWALPVRPAPGAGSRLPVTRKAVDRLERKARNNRNRLIRCTGCGQRARGTRSSDLICGTCFRRWAEGLPGEIRDYLLENAPGMDRIDPTPEEILESAAMAHGAEVAA